MMTRIPRPAEPRLPLVTDPSPDVADTLAKTMLRDGQPLNVFSALAHHPRILKRFNALGGAYLAHGTLPVRDRELVILRVGALCGSVYEFGQHTVIGRGCGLTEEEIVALATDPDRINWPPHEAVLFTMVDELFVDNCISDATWAALADRFDPAQLVEIVTMVGFYRMLAGFLNTLGVTLESGTPGWPDGFGEERT